MKRRVALEIHREDHKIDALGRIFLGATDRDETLSLRFGEGTSAAAFGLYESLGFEERVAQTR